MNRQEPVVYYSFFALTEGIKFSEAVKNRHHIFLDDDVYKLQLGWICKETNESWRIGLSDLKRSNLDEGLKRLMIDPSGREKWANDLLVNF